MDHFKLHRAVVAGPSMGAAVALASALRHLDRVAALVMIGPAYGGGELGLSEFQAKAFAQMDALARQALSQGVESLRPLYQAAPALEAWFETVKASLHLPGFAATSALMASGAQPFARNSELAAIRAPTLLIPGDDPMHPAAVSALLAANISGCIVGAAAQSTNTECVISFLKSLETRP